MNETERHPDAWLYENEYMLYKHKYRRADLLERGFTETPLHYTPRGEHRQRDSAEED